MMAQDLYRLIYLSNNEITGDATIIQQEIRQILTISRQRNAEVGITGALMFNKNCFAQVLKGPHDQLQETFERIQCDPRHSNVIILNFESMQTRHFSQWSMAYVSQEAADSAQFARIQKDSGFDPNQLTGERIYDLLHVHLQAAEKNNSNQVY